MRLLRLVLCWWVLGAPAFAANCTSYPSGCDPAAAIYTDARTSISTIDPCYCPYETPTNANYQRLIDKGCVVISGVLTCGEALPDFRSYVIVHDTLASLDGITATTDDYEFYMAGTGTTLTQIGCHCDANCGTTATVSFKDRAGNAIGLTGGGDLTCSSSTGATTYTTFLTSDADRILVTGEGVRLSITNSPTTDQRITLHWFVTTP